MPPINYKWHHQIVKFPQIYKKWFKMWFLTFLYILFTFFTFFCYAALLQSFGWHIWCWYCFEHLKLWHLSRQMHCSNLGCKWSHGVDIGRCSGSLSISLLHLKSGIDSSPLYITVDPSDYMSLCSIIIYPVLCMLAHYPAVKVHWDAWKDRAIVSNTCPVPVMTGPSVSSEY